MFGRLNLDITHMGTGEVSSILSMILIKLKKRPKKAPLPILFTFYRDKVYLVD